MPPQLTTSLDRDAVLLEAIDDRQGAEGGGFDQGAVDLRRRGVQRLADQQAGQQRIDQDRAVAVVPVQGQQAALAGPQPLRPRGSRARARRRRPCMRRAPGA